MSGSSGAAKADMVEIGFGEWWACSKQDEGRLGAKRGVEFVVGGVSYRGRHHHSIYGVDLNY